jgi:DNA-binding transcriptional regulator YiaG
MNTTIGTVNEKHETAVLKDGQSCVLTPLMSAQDIKNFRHSRGLTQKQFADAYGINLRTLKRWEGEDVVSPRFTAPFQKLLRELFFWKSSAEKIEA